MTAPRTDMAAPLRDVSPAALARLTRLAERPVRVALMGEFSSGKSTLLNVLAGREVAPTQVVATHVPSLWLQAGAGPDTLLMPDGARLPADGDWARHPRLDAAAAVCLGGYAGLPGGCEFIDTPGISDPLLAADALDWVERRADIALWCTPAPQAWRQTEKLAWLARTARLRRRGILVVTQADRLKPSDLDRVLGRLLDETAEHFAEILSVAAPLAASGDDGWARSGVAGLVDTILAEASAVKAERAALLARYRAVEPVLVLTSEHSADAAAPAEPAALPSAAEALAIWDRAVADTPPESPPTLVAERFIAALAAARPQADPKQAPWFALLRSVTESEAAETGRLLKQMRGEIADFAQSAWCDLATA
ncbi:MAG: dynamin family protein [Pseudomonadota bacterium]